MMSTVFVNLMITTVIFVILKLVLPEEILLGKTKLPVIIWWNDNVFPHFSSSEEITCGLGKCLTTKSREVYKQGETYTMLAFMFYGTDLKVEDLPVNSRYNQSIFWALLHEESPMNKYVLSHDYMIELFNYTATFSRHSDYPLTTIFLPSREYLTERAPVTLDVKNEFRAKGAAPIIYVQSNCNVPSDRDRYVAELARFVPIDSYGQCLHNKDLSPDLNTPEAFNDVNFYDFIANYKFHLAFENAICNDYVTEKLYRALHVGSVPIYRGSPTVLDWLPDNSSAILVDKFDSPKDLAYIVLNIDANDTQYETYLRYKNQELDENNNLAQQLTSRQWTVLDDDTKLHFIHGYECFICDKMIELLKLPEKDRIPKIANARHLGCPPPISSITSDSVVDSKRQNHKEWIDDYWYEYNVAKSLQNMIVTRKTGTGNLNVNSMALSEKDEL